MPNNTESTHSQTQKESFIASLSHDLKNPTIAQIRTLELILEGKFGELLPQQKEVVKMILESCKYMNSMLDNILITCKESSGKIYLMADKISLTDIIEECKNEMIYWAKEKKIELSFQNIASQDIICGDKLQMKRLIINLLATCIKCAYSKTKIFIEEYNEDNYTCLKIENKSPYFPSKQIADILSRHIMPTDGIGLGLYVASKIAEAHGGKIFIKSRKNKNNVVGLKIPNDEVFETQQRYLIL